MIILDTHIWVWWTDENSRLRTEHQQYLHKESHAGLGVSVFSLWEIAKLVEKERIQFAVSLREWFDEALSRPNIRLLPLSPQIIVDSIQLPGAFHKDPADQAIVATARVYDCDLLTYDSQILSYPHVKVLP